MTATEIVTKMMNEFEAKHGKPATEISLGWALYDSLRDELKEQIPSDMVIGTIKLRGVLIKRQKLQ